MKYYRFMDLDEFMRYNAGKTIRKTIKESTRDHIGVHQGSFIFIPEDFRISEVLCRDPQFEKFASMFREAKIELFQLLDILEETLRKDVVIEFESNDALPEVRQCWEDSRICCFGSVNALEKYSTSTMRAVRYGWYTSHDNIEWYANNMEVSSSVDEDEAIRGVTRPRATRYF